MPLQRIQLAGSPAHQWRAIRTLIISTLKVMARRWRKGSLRPTWKTSFEIMTDYLKQSARDASSMPTIAEQRAYLDTLRFISPVMSQVSIEESAIGSIRGRWFVPHDRTNDATLLFLHGGGYAFYSHAHENLIVLVALAARARTFALDYRLTPEHPYPAQLEDALLAYRWLLSSGTDARKIVVAGDSAGGNLALALLQALRDSKEPQPALAICLCPWIDLSCSGDSMVANLAYDWIEKPIAVTWGQWFMNGADPHDPYISPLYADLRDLPPIYIQAGGAETLIDMIRAFARNAEEQGAVVWLEEWADMNHDFQAYGAALPESTEALRRIGEVVQEYTGTESHESNSKQEHIA